MTTEESFGADPARPRYSEADAESFANYFLATQIRVLREQLGLNQTQLAFKIGTTQSVISKIESVHCWSWNSETLRKVARAFGLRLKVSLEPYETLPDEIDAFCRETAKRPLGLEDPGIRQFRQLMQTMNERKSEDESSTGTNFFTNPNLEMRPTVIDEMAVINRLWELASMTPDETKGNIAGQTRAANALAEIKGMKLLRKADLEAEFRDRTQEEMTFFAIHGYWPTDTEPAAPITPAYRDPTDSAPRPQSEAPGGAELNHQCQKGAPEFGPMIRP